MTMNEWPISYVRYVTAHGRAVDRWTMGESELDIPNDARIVFWGTYYIPAETHEMAKAEFENAYTYGNLFGPELWLDELAKVVGRRAYDEKWDEECANCVMLFNREQPDDYEAWAKRTGGLCGEAGGQACREY